MKSRSQSEPDLFGEIAQTKSQRDYVEYEIQHSSENRNPYDNLVAPLNTTQTINIQLAAPEVQGRKKRSIMTEIGTLDETHSQIPPVYVLAVGEVLRELKLPSISMRTTAGEIDFLPSARKPGLVKYKVVHAGPGSDVIPYGRSATLMWNDKGEIVAMKQNPAFEPKLEKGITTMQFTIPLEKIMLGINKKPPEYILVQEPGSKLATGTLDEYSLKFKINSPDPAIADVIYKIDLMDLNKVSRLQHAAARISPAADMKPAWWANSFMEFKNEVQCGFPLSCQYPQEKRDEPFLIYARIGEDGKPRMITGDQDLHHIPRTDFYSLGDYAYEVIDTHAPEGARKLMNALNEVHEAIMLEDIAKMKMDPTVIDPQARRASIEGYKQNKIDQIKEFIVTSKNYIEDLGVLTPFEAYVIVSINIKQMEIKKQMEENPRMMLSKLNSVHVSNSKGLDFVLENKLDIDLHHAWFGENHNPAACVAHIQSQLSLNRRVSPGNLYDFMQVLEAKPETVREAMAVRRHSLTMYAPLQKTRLEDRIENTMKGVSNIEIFIRGDNLKMQQWRVGDDLALLRQGLKDMIVVTHEDKKVAVLHFSDKTISSNKPGEEGVAHIQRWMRQLDISPDKASVSQQQPVSEINPKGRV